MKIVKVTRSASEGGVFYHSSEGGRFFFSDGQEDQPENLGEFFSDAEEWMFIPWPETDDDNPTDIVDVSDEYQDLINYSAE